MTTTKPIKPMLLTEYPDKIDIISIQEYVFIQPKLNGWRCVANIRTGELFSRTGQKFNLPELTKQLLEIAKNFSDEITWIDGELYKHGKTLPEIQSMIKTGSDEIEFHVFDVVSRESFKNRFYDNKYIAVSNIFSVLTIAVMPSQIMPHYQEFLNDGYEGAVIRLDNLPYHFYRSEQVIKLKPEIWMEKE